MFSLRRFQQSAETVLVSITAITCIVAVIDVLRLMHYEYVGAVVGDADSYFAMGRGILNGLTPYRDLFEIKPPGIFFVTAASLWLTDGPAFAQVMQIIVLLIILVLPAWWAVRASQLLRGKDRVLLICTGFLFGALITLYTAEHAGEVQVESFGLAFAAWYVTIISRIEQWSIKHTAAAALLLAASIGFKEPFLLSIIASVLLCTPSWNVVRTRFLLPLCGGAMLGIGILASLKWLGAYLAIYLPFAIGTRALKGRPLWTRGLEVSNIAESMWSFSPSLLILTIFLLICVLLWQLNTRPLQNAILGCLRILAAVYLLALSVGIGLYPYAHYQIFMVPGIFALFYTAINIWQNDRRIYAFLSQLVVVLLLIGGILIHTRHNYPERIVREQAYLHYMKSVSDTLDAVLDRCNIDRYVHLVDKGGGPYGLTKHSPAGPVFLLYSRTNIPGQSVSAMLRQHSIILTAENGFNFAEHDASFVSTHFSEEPWPCAQPYSKPKKPYSILFLKQQ